MKIEMLRITNHHILRNIAIDFEQSSTTSEDRAATSTIDLLVGVNGTGKSTLLRSLAIIFQCLEQKSIPPFGFEIRYRLSGKSEAIYVSNLLDPEEDFPQLTSRLRFNKSDDEKIKREDIHDILEVSTTDLPRHIIALTSGSEAGWVYNGTKTDKNDLSSPFIDPSMPLADQLQDWKLLEMPVSSPEMNNVHTYINPSSPFLLITSDIIPYAVLCGLLSNMYNNGKYLDHVLKACKIEGLRGFSLQLHIEQDQIPQDQRPFIERLWKNASYIVKTGTNYLLVFALTAQNTETALSSQTASSQQGIQIQQLLGEGGDGLAFLIQLLHLIVPNPNRSDDPILCNVNLFLESSRPLSGVVYQAEDHKLRSSLYLFNWLSDGEQSFLGRLCLLPLLSHNEALLLLDEPEVHFNDYWKHKLIQMISQALRKQQDDRVTSHVIMTTHSSITLSDIANTNIWMLERYHDNESRAIRPLLRTLGTDPSDIIVHIFGAESAVGAYSSAYIREQIEQVRASDRQSSAERISRLNELLEQIGPGYWRYLIRREILSLEAPELWRS